MDISVGDTFFADFPKEDPHLFFIVLDICKTKPHLFICSMLSSWKDKSPYCDNSCILDKGDHPFIRHKSYIAYRETLILTHEELLRLIQIGKFTIDKPATPELIRKIKNSALKSKFLPQNVRNYIIESELSD